jgi:predicted lipoprotein with Yx(FWY)xxD motif
VSTLTTKNYGTILQSSRTVYTLSPSKVACTAKCLTYWPEVLLPKGTTKVSAGHGVNGAELGTIKRADGRLQVTYAGKALYRFANDKSPGQVKGNVSDTWGKWSVVVLIKPAGGGGPTTTTTSGGAGGGVGF